MPMNNREEPFHHGRVAQSFLRLEPINDSLHLLFKEIERQILLRAEIVKQRSLSHPCFSGNLPRRGPVKSARRKQIQGHPQNLLLRRLFVLLPLPGCTPFWRRTFPSGRGRSFFLKSTHKMSMLIFYASRLESAR